MQTEAPVLATPKFRRYTSPKGEFYLASDIVTDNGKPKVYVRRWNADSVLRSIETQYPAPEGSIQLPTLSDSHTAAEQDEEVRDSIFSRPSEWQSTLILNPNAPAETQEYVLMDDEQRVLQKSRKPRSLNPVKRYQEGDRQIVVANVFDIPFKLQNFRYNPEDLDPETGFLRKLDPNGKYGVWFGDKDRLYAVILRWNGDADCVWEPGYPIEAVGLRGRSTGNLPAELLESEVDILRARLERSESKRRA